MGTKFTKYRKQYPKKFAVITVGIVIIVLVIVIVPTVLVLTKKSSFDVKFQNVPEFVGINDKFSVTLASNQDISSLPKVSDFAPAALSVELTSPRVITVSFIVSQVSKIKIVLAANAITSKTGSKNKKVTSKEITVSAFPPPGPFSVMFTNVPASTAVSEVFSVNLSTNADIKLMPLASEFAPKAYEVRSVGPRLIQVKFVIKIVEKLKITLAALSVTDTNDQKNTTAISSPEIDVILPAPVSIAVPAPTKVTLAADRRDFYSIMSTDMMRGRNNLGQLVTNTGTILEPGIDTIATLESYPPTYPIGHPYYNNTSFGKLVNGSWQSYTNAYPTANKISSLFTNAQLTTQTNIIVIEANTSGSATYVYAPVVLDVNVDVEGIVVRHGGILLVSPNCTKIRTQFILVESGGLFQVGSHFQPSYRFDGNLNIELSHTDAGGFLAMGSVASQYSFNCYHPGATSVTDTSSNKLVTDFSGEQLNHNSFGAKVLAVGFNGTLEMSSVLPERQPYSGTWTVIDDDTKMPYMDKNDFMTYLDPRSPAALPNSELADLPMDYPAVWVRMADSIANNGDTTIKVDPLDVGDWLEQWKPGMQIIITGRNPVQMTVAKDPAGILPFYFDAKDDTNKNANLAANAAFVAPYNAVQQTNPPLKQYGHEMATIQSVNVNTGEITLAAPLQFVHDSQHKVTTRTIEASNLTKKIRIPTSCHIGLLTRNIKISSYLSSGGNGANRLPSQVPTPVMGVWQGPGGSVVCNAAAVKSGIDVYTKCYQTQDQKDATYCAGINPQTLVIDGTYIFETQGKSGPNTVLGGHTMMRYGSSSWADGVQQQFLGQPGQFGSIARYGWHFHMAGFPTWFNGYLLSAGSTEYGEMPDVTTLSDLDAKIWRRQATLANGSGHQLFTRHCTVHGTSGATTRNQVSFFNYGSTFFVEDGVEIDLIFDHILSVATIQCLHDSYQNPIPISGLVGSDLAVPSAFWYKSNAVRSSRNVVCGLASGVVAYWLVPQRISTLRGPSAVMLGNGNLKLPGTGTAWNATKGGLMGMLSQNNNGWQQIKDDVGLTQPCWTPPEFVTKARAGIISGCPMLNLDNSQNPLQMFAENVTYQGMVLSNFPEYLQRAPVGMVSTSESFATTPNFALNNANVSVVGFVPKPQYIPSNGQNSCTDTAPIGGGPYTQNSWAGVYPEDFPFKPLSDATISAYQTNRLARSQIVTASITPYIFSGMLTYSTNAAGNLEPALWSKQSPTMFISCCFVETTYRTQDLQRSANFCETGQGAGPPWATWSTNTNNTGGNPSIGSFNPGYAATAQVSAGGDGQEAYAALFHSYHNCIISGGFAIPSNSQTWGMSKTFFDDGVRLMSSEYNHFSQKGGLLNMFTYDLPPGIDDAKQLFPAGFWQNRAQDLNDVYIYDKQNQKCWKIPGNEGLQANCTPGTSPVQITFPPRANEPSTRKMPFMFGDDNRLLRISSSNDPSFNEKRPDWFDIAINAMTYSFLTPYGISVGDEIAKQQALIPKCYLPLDAAQGLKVCCSVEANFNNCS